MVVTGGGGNTGNYFADDITFASGKGIKYQQGTGQVKTICSNNADYLEAWNWAGSARRYYSAAQLNTPTIAEVSAGTGVTIDSVLIKDNLVELQSLLRVCPLVTPTEVQAGTTSGNCTNNANGSDNNTATTVTTFWDAITRTWINDFALNRRISEYRIYGNVGNTGDGRAKLETYDPDTATWTEVQTGIVARNAASWLDWTALTTETIGSRIRLSCTTIDSSPSGFEEFEVRGVV